MLLLDRSAVPTFTSQSISAPKVWNICAVKPGIEAAPVLISSCDLSFCGAAPEILRLSATVQGIWHAHERIRQHRHGKWEEVFKPATFYEFVAVIKDRRFKVIVKELEGQGKQFWSLIPFWRQNEKGTLLLHDADPSVD
jgi:hypothetical protein